MSKLKSLNNKKILITCGPTWVPLDGVRVLSNQSTGQLGQQLAQNFLKAKAKVTLIEGPVQRPLTASGIRILKFRFYNELKLIIERELHRNYDIIIHAAAVSDYQLKKPLKSKMSSQKKSLKLTLVPTEKIIDRIKKIKPHAVLIGFKLQTSKKQLFSQAIKLLQQAHCDFVIANVANANNYFALIIDKNRNVLAQVRSKKDLSQKLVNLLDKNP